MKQKLMKTNHQKTRLSASSLTIHTLMRWQSVRLARSIAVTKKFVKFNRGGDGNWTRANRFDELIAAPAHPHVFQFSIKV